MEALRALTVGIDEVGRGALAGPLAVGAVAIAMPAESFVADLLAATGLRQLRDSKRLSHPQRQKVAGFLDTRPGVFWGVGEASAAEIDALGLTRAASLASGRALAALKEYGVLPAEVLADAGLHHPFEKSVPTRHYVKGDETILQITLASIIAKEWRDGLMRRLALEYPVYGFERHVGYGTKAHRQAVREHGLLPLHRRSFCKSLIT